MADRRRVPSLSRCTVVRKLTPGRGFSFNLAPSREDKLARDAAEHVFGTAFVDECFSRLHRSTLSYEALLADLGEYERPRVRKLVNDPIYELALESVRRDLAVERKLVPYTTGAVPELPDFPRQKSPGLPWKWSSLYKTKGDVVDIPKNMTAVRSYWYLVGDGVPHPSLPDVCLFARAQVCDVGKEKIRGVWGYPLLVYLEEARFFYPILEFLKGKSHSFPVAYGCEISKGGMLAISNAAQQLPGGKYLMTDWSKFDKSIPPWLIRDAFDLLAEIIDFGVVLDSKGFYWPVDPVKSLRRWKKIIDYFIETPIRTCRGERFLVCGGVPSGSCFTNVIDTVVNCIVQRYISYATIGSFPRAEIYLGDDGVCMFAQQSVISLDVMSDIAFGVFGLVLSRDKSYVTSNIENIHFLGYYNHPPGYPHREQDLLVVSFVHPEQSRDTAEECAAAALGQLWSNFNPYTAGLWFRVLQFIDRRYSLDTNEALLQLRRSAHRHKYLSHIGRDVGVITVPCLTDLGLVLDVQPNPSPPKLVYLRDWDYTDLLFCMYS